MTFAWDGITKCTCGQGQFFNAAMNDKFRTNIERFLRLLFCVLGEVLLSCGGISHIATILAQFLPIGNAPFL